VVEPVLKGTVALVTGASSGIGAATAAALAAQGATVALAARRRDRLEALAADITGQGGTALVLECDVTDQQQAAGAVERTAAELGRLDTLINNAGVMLLGPVVGAPLAEWQQMVELNVLGLLYCAHAALSLRQEVAKRYVRVSLVEPGATATELAGHNRPEVLESIRNQFGQTMAAQDIADAIAYIISRPRHVAVNEMLIRPTEQER
jgi:NADP-dependent 3-hydroxy acid dehydrogenase YdfG